MSTTVQSVQEDKVYMFARAGELVKLVREKIKPFNFKSLGKIPNFKSKQMIFIIVALIVIVGITFFVRSRGNDFQNADNTYVSEGPKLSLNKKFNVPIRSSDGKTVGSDLVVNVTTLERTNEVLYKGKPLVARSSKDFLVINLEVENSTNNRLTVRPVDFFRLVDASGKTYAPDIQTDAVKVEPLSSKKTRTIYIIAEDQKTIRLTIGEIKGENKETVDINI